MYGSEREKEILKLLSQNDYVTVEYLAKKIHISPSSIRRDLKKLELEGHIIRSYGGAELKESGKRQIPFDLRSHQNAKEKTLVAKKASELVKQGDVVFLDGSTSTYFMLMYLKDIKGITVITNSLAGMNLCAEYGINAYFTGGKPDPENPSCLVGTHTENMINSFHADIFFFSVQSLSDGGIMYDCFENETAPRMCMMKNSEKSVLLCDSSKLNRFSPYKLCGIEKIDCIISDTDIKAYLKGDYPKLHFITAN